MRYNSTIGSDWNLCILPVDAPAIVTANIILSIFILIEAIIFVTSKIAYHLIYFYCYQCSTDIAYILHHLIIVPTVAQ